jgi:glycerophosphoryl diester phosphodiesterase
MPTKRGNTKNLDLITTPNRILEAIAEFSVYQLRIYVTIVELLREAAKKSFDEGNVAVQDILSQEMISLCIPLKKISKPSEYRDVKKSLLQMSKISCEITYNENNKKQMMSGSLFSVDLPLEANWKSTIKIMLHPQVAKLMLTFQRNNEGKPIYYSRFSPNIIQSIRNKHTIRLYFLLCLWRNRSNMNISVDKLYQFLGLGSTYSLFSNFKKHILIPSHKDLANHGDVWFDINDPEFIVKQGSRTIGLNFKIITQVLIEDREVKKLTIINILKNHYRFNALDIEQINDIVEGIPYLEIMNKITDLSGKITHEIKHPKQYIIASLKGEFQNHIQ